MRSEWKTKWPRTRAVKAWIVASGEKARAVGDPEERVDKLAFAVARLGELGYRAEARRLLKVLERDIARHPAALEANLNAVAEAFVEAGQPAGARAVYVRAMEAVRGDAKLKRERREQRLASLRRDAIRAGLADLFDDLTDEERAGVAYEAAVKRAEAAIADGDRASAGRAAKEAERSAGKDLEWHQLQRLFDLYARAGDKRSALRLLRAMDEEDQSVTLVGGGLVRLGLRKQAVGLARAEVRRGLDEARGMTLPDYHHAADTVASAVEFLIEHDEREAARRELVVAMTEAKSWQTHRAGWVGAAVYAKFAGAIVKLDGLEAARVVLEHASAAAKSDRTVTAGTGWEAVIDVYEAGGGWDEALRLAGKLRSADDRRQRTAIVLAKAGRWKELAKVLSTVRTPEEASDLAWWVAIRLAQE